MGTLTIEQQSLVEMAIKATQLTRAAVDNGSMSRLMGCVGAAIETDEQRIFTGVNLEFYCSMGFCAEHSAVADMIKHGYTRIYQVVAATFEGVVIPPCGRCRELMHQLNDDNLNATVIVSADQVMRLKDLLPNRWQDLLDPSSID